MRDSVLRTLIGLLVTQALVVFLLPLVLIPPPDGLELNIYVIGLKTAREIVVEAAAGTVVLFTLAVWLQRQVWITAFATAVPLFGLALVAAPFWVNTGGIAAGEMAGKGGLFFLGYILLAVLLGTVYWFMAVGENRDWGRRDRDYDRDYERE